MAEISGAPPPALAAKPEVLPGLGSYVEAFNVLCGARAMGLAGPLPIPLSEIESYCRLTGWRDREAVVELVAIVQAMDAAYLQLMACRSGGEEIVPRPDEAPMRCARAQDSPGSPPGPVWSGRRTQK